MSFRGGRGGGAGSTQRNLPFGLSFADVNPAENDEIPQISLPVNNPVTEQEKDLANIYITFQETIKDGPFYTGALNLHSKEEEDENEEDGQKKKKKANQELFDYEDGINDGIKRYSDKYRKKRKIGRSIDEHPYQLELFPQELYKVMGIDKKKLLAISDFKQKEKFLGGGKDEDLGLSMLEKLKNMAEEEDDVKEDDNDGDDREEDIDDDFDDEDDDDDYNAEKYFDDGEDFEEGGDDNDEATY